MKSFTLKSLILLGICFFSFGCRSINPPESAEVLYDQALNLFDQGTYNQAAPIFEKVIDENPGTRYATFSYLKLGEAYHDGGTYRNYDKAELNYQIFLQRNPQSHLVPYVLSRLIALNFEQNKKWSLFGSYYDHERDPAPFKKILKEYQRFFLLYPESQYLKTVKVYRDKALEALASHELMIGDWYYVQAFYPSAIARYTYLLRHYPHYTKQREVVEKLILAYYKNQRSDLAEELQRVYQFQSSGSPTP